MVMLKRRRSPGCPDDALAAAEKLDRAGRALDAITLLTEANRARRDRRVEQRLVELRLDAFPTLAASSSRAVWPEVVEDLAPGELIPAVRREDLTVDCVRSALWNHGSLIVRGLIGRESAECLVDDIDTATAAFDARASGEERDDVAGWYVPAELSALSDERRMKKRKGGNLVAVESPPTLFDLIEIMNAVGIGELARGYFGEAPALLARKVTLRRMAHDAHGAWHQDGSFMGADLRSLNVWLALTPCGDDAPSLDVVGRRLDSIIPPSPTTHTKSGITAETVEQIAAGTIVRPRFEPGDAMIFDHLCLHRTGGDPSMTRGRYAIETWLMAPSTYSASLRPVEDGPQPHDQLPLVF
jgi:hypothetical protein